MGGKELKRIEEKRGNQREKEGTKGGMNCLVGGVDTLLGCKQSRLFPLWTSVGHM